MHVGSSSNMIKTSDDMPTLAAMAYGAPVNQAGALLDWLFSGNFERFPKLKIALSEGSIGRTPTPREGRTGRRQAAVLGLRFDSDLNANR